MAYVYKHIRKDTNEIFYIGIGFSDSNKFRRAYRKDNRNSIWRNIINKTEYTVEIIKSNISWEEAKSIEIELIKKFGKIKKGGVLANITDGGDGVLGISYPAWNKGKKLHYDVWLKGKKMSDDYKLKCSINAKKRIEEKGHHMKGKRHTESTKYKMRIAKLGKRISESKKEAISKTRIRKKVGKFINNVLIETYDSIMLASIYTGISKGQISLILNNKIKTPKKYDYELKEI